MVKAEFGTAGIGALGSAHATVEELHLLGKLVRGLGSESVDHRLRHADFSLEQGGVRWLGTSIESLSLADGALVIGSFLRKDHPLFAQRLRQAARHGAQIAALGAVADDWAMPLAARINAAPSDWVAELEGIVAAATLSAGGKLPEGAAEPTQAQRDVVAALSSGATTGATRLVLLGNAVAQHPQASLLLALANQIAARTGARIGFLGEAANSVGAQLVGAQPRTGSGGLDAGQMLSQPMKALLLLDVEPELDAADGAAARAALAASGLVVALTAFADTTAAEVADVLLPITPFSETSGTFVNAEGRAQSFHGVVRPHGQARPAWKVLRVLGNLLGLAGFDFETSEQVRDEALGDVGRITARLSNAQSQDAASAGHPLPKLGGVERIADVPIYSTDALVRRASSLQLTADAKAPVASLPSALWRRLGLYPGSLVRIGQGAGRVLLPAVEEASLPDGVVRVPAGHPDTAALGAMFGPLIVERA